MRRDVRLEGLRNGVYGRYLMALVILIVLGVSYYLYRAGENKSALPCVCPHVRPLPGPDGFIANPSWSPDGNWLAFERAEVATEDPFGGILYATSEIYLIRPDGTDLTRITHDQVQDGAPSWSPDSRHLVFASVTQLTKPQQAYLSIYNRDTGAFEKVFQCPSGCGGPVWSPDNRWIAFRMPVDGSHLNGTAIWLLDLESFAAQQAAIFADSVVNLSWSPDSQYILASEYESETRQRHIVRINIDSLEAQSVFLDDRDYSYTAWYPAQNIQAVVWTGISGNGRQQNILIIDAGGDAKSVFDQPLDGLGIAGLALAPDERHLAFVYGGNYTRLYIADLNR